MTGIRQAQPGELTKAVEEGRADLARQLLDAGADVDERNQFGNTPLYKAAGRGDEVLTQLLISRGADINNRNDHAGSTPLMWAAGKGKAGTVRLLLEAGADTDNVSKTGHTATSYARNHGHEEVIALIEAARQERKRLKEEMQAQRMKGLRDRASRLKPKGPQP